MNLQLPKQSSLQTVVNVGSFQKDTQNSTSILSSHTDFLVHTKNYWHTVRQYKNSDTQIVAPPPRLQLFSQQADASTDIIYSVHSVRGVKPLR